MQHSSGQSLVETLEYIERLFGAATDRLKTKDAGRAIESLNISIFLALRHEAAQVAKVIIPPGRDEGDEEDVEEEHSILDPCYTDPAIGRGAGEGAEWQIL